MKNLLEDRQLGPSGLVIGTHLALETFFYKDLDLYDKDRDFVKGDINKYSYHVYNVFTIARNILNACLYKNKEEIIMDPSFPKVMKFEVTQLSEYYKGTNCTPLLFYPDYKPIYSGYNVGKETADTANYREHMLIKGVLSKMNIKACNNNKGYVIPKLKGEILLTTNIPVDLFNPHNITLLESHTGKLKTRSEWNSKYHPVGKADLTNLPYVEELLYILGDKIIVTPCDIKTRKELVAIATKHKWNPRTTRMQVISDLNRYNMFRVLIKKFKRMYT